MGSWALFEINVVTRHRRSPHFSIIHDVSSKFLLSGRWWVSLAYGRGYPSSRGISSIGVRMHWQLFWPLTEAAIERITAPLDSYQTETTATNAMKITASAKLTTHIVKVAEYRYTVLPDGANSRPCAAGQLVLNGGIQFIRLLAFEEGWGNVGNVANPNPNTANPCHLPFPAYIP